jgi:hypothetical protein
VSLSPSSPFKGESFRVNVKLSIGGSIGTDGITWLLPAALITFPTVELWKPAIDTISPAYALYNSISFIPNFLTILIILAFS